MPRNSRSEIATNLKPYLDNIAIRLSTKHAAVMVGSGFSRNATKQNATEPGFPDWSDLGDIFARTLYKHEQTTHTRYMSVATLAHEVEAGLGRPALNQMIREAIPDLEHEPSRLHIDLLNLPWADVFTTNYDTLLERASRTHITRRYDFVLNHQDLVFAERPRIIKLHGGLPEPFIITDEDYRSYPDKSAPLLNTVRQCLLENTLCLIGFSGTDPNFLQWVGWLHDNLGRKQSSRIYLIGTFNLSASQIQLLERRNIVVLDMSQCDGVKPGDHYSAVERFIDYLKTKETNVGGLRWPTTEQAQFPRWDKLTLKELSAKTHEWKTHRLKYPGWLIVPSDRRQVLKRSVFEVLSSWDAANPLHESDLPLFVDLDFAYELLWRTEKCLSPIFDPQLNFYKCVLDRYWPFAIPNSNPTLPSIENPISDLHTLSYRQIRAKIHHLALAILRYYRQEGMHAEWTTISNQLRACLDVMSPEHHAHYHYELALASLFDLNPKQLIDSIKDWDPNESLPLWEAKRAGLLAEAGEVEEAKTILSQSLKSIRTRSNLKPVSDDYSLVAQEAHVMYMLNYLPLPIWELANPDHSKTDDDDARLSMFQQYQCDPAIELKLFELILDRPKSIRTSVTERPAFDIGQTNRTYSVFGTDNELATSFNFLHFCEDTGMPLRMSRKAASGVLSRIANHAPHWAIVSLLRLGDQSSSLVDSMFSRHSLSRFSPSSIDGLIRRFLNALESAKPEINATNHDLDYNLGIQFAKVVPEVLSRLCSKCSRQARWLIFDFLEDIYDSEHKVHYTGIRHLMHRLLQTFSIPDRIEAITRLLDFPVVSHASPLVGLEFLNPFHFLDLNEEWLSDAPQPPRNKVDFWLTNASSSDHHVRQWAVFTLARLHDWSLLSEDQAQSLGLILWSQCDETGWPMHTGLRRIHVVNLPSSGPHDPIDLFKRYVRETSFPENASPKTATMGGDKWTVLDDIRWASQQSWWDEEDALLALSRCISWWEAHKNKSELKVPTDAFMFGESDFKQTVLNLMGTIASVAQSSDILAKDGSMEQRIQHLIYDFAKHGFLVNRLESACLGSHPEKRNKFFNELNVSLASFDAETFRDSLHAVRVLFDRANLSSEHGHKQELSNLLLTVSQIIFWRRSTGLPETIETVSYAIETRPRIVNESLEHLLLNGLQNIIDETMTHVPTGRRQELVVDESDFAKRLVVRRNAARLAFVLYNYYTADDDVVPAIVSEWQAICRSDDEFAEIRNEWTHD